MASLSCTKINFGLYIFVDRVNDRYFSFWQTIVYLKESEETQAYFISENKIKNFRLDALYNLVMPILQ